MTETIKEDQNDIVTLVQITDTHLFSDPEGELLGVNTLQSFTAIVNNIVEEEVDYQAIIMTGDVSQDHSQGSYERFEDIIEPLGKTCYWLPGNHDYKPSMKAIYPSPQINKSRHLLAGKYWQIIMLDSQDEGFPHGQLYHKQIDFLDAKLTEYPDRFTLILLHHHPVPVGSAWLDKHILKNSDEFWQVIDEHRRTGDSCNNTNCNIKAILSGHVHQDYHRQHKGIQVITSPSTCIQFKPNSDDFALDPVSPGWRKLALLPDGKVSTEVHRLPEKQFLPDFLSQGY